MGAYSIHKLLFVHLQMYMYIQSTMHQLAKLKTEAHTHIHTQQTYRSQIEAGLYTCE